jgi:A/G-specific adenine glycosylase
VGDLPWRQTRDPWAVAVSEVMLQQTQVARVIPKWVAFLQTFPTVGSCAEAPQAEVVRRWEGLGYHRRAVSLHRAAIAVVERFDGVFPSTISELQTLPGFGPYTSRAVVAFAFEGDAAVVDTNVGRIVARAVAGRSCSAREAQSIADALVPSGESWAWNQGMLDLGAMVCTKRMPRCHECPINRMCAWYLVGLPEPDPAVGSAAVSAGQSRFLGSDRQGRGRLLAALRRGPVSLDDVAITMGWADDEERAHRVAATLVLDGLARRNDTEFALA